MGHKLDGQLSANKQPSLYVTNTKVNLTFYPSRVSACLAGVKERRIRPCSVADNTVWYHLAGVAP